MVKTDKRHASVGKNDRTIMMSNQIEATQVKDMNASSIDPSSACFQGMLSVTHYTREVLDKLVSAVHSWFSEDGG